MARARLMTHGPPIACCNFAASKGPGSFPLENGKVSIERSDVHNQLLKAMSPQCFAAISSDLKPLDLALGYVLVEVDVPTDQVVFLEGGLGSIVATAPDGEKIEVGHLGYEGMSGMHILLKTRRTPNRTFMQVAGSGLAIPVDRLEQVLQQHPEDSDLLLRYVQSCELQLAYSALANARYEMPQRLARWLLMSHDRIRLPDLPLTHEFLSIMLGVRRPGVTDQVHILEGLGIIKATRGNIQILDRPKLEKLAGGCYGIPEREYERLVIGGTD
jgi:CRP-like cAMP-binding protein